MPVFPSKRWKRRLMQIIGILLLGGLLLFSIAWLIAAICFTGSDHSSYDSPRPKPVGTRTAESAEHAAMARLIAEGMAHPPSEKGQRLLLFMRKHLDERGEAANIDAAIRPVDADGVPGEWVTAPHVVPGRRLLYIHGGGYVAGSPKSHRPLTSRFSDVSDAAVLSIDYRLMPEHSRMAGIEDCRAAYHWIVENGPEGKSPADVLIVAGDSSGGNLALSTVAWARDSRLRRADAVVALSPQTDSTLTSPSLRTNIETDIMQGKTLGPVVRSPRSVSLWVVYLMHRINPGSPLMSPLLGDLSDLPPTLLQASETEMFLDDSVRYANKTNAQGSIAVVQTWPFTMHVWHAFDVPEADEAFEEIRKFLAIHAASQAPR
jgi:acetyl esterase/lipase